MSICGMCRHVPAGAHLVVKVVGEKHCDFWGADVDVGVRQVCANLHRIGLSPEVRVYRGMIWQRLPCLNLCMQRIFDCHLIRYPVMNDFLSCCCY